MTEATLRKAVDYLSSAMHLYAGMMVGESHSQGALNAAKWKHILEQVCLNGERIAHGEQPKPVAEFSLVSKNGIFTEGC